MQALLLCAQFGAYSGDRSYLRWSEKQITSVSVVCQIGHFLFKHLKLTTGSSFSKNIWNRSSRKVVLHIQIGSLGFSQRLLVGMYNWSPVLAFGCVLTSSCRLAGWLSILSGVVLAYQPTATIVIYPLEHDVPLPCTEELWGAKSSEEWIELSRDIPDEAMVGVVSMYKMMSSGHSCPGKLSAFGLLVVLGSIFADICMRERLSLGYRDEPEISFITKMERTLASWELSWRRHPQAARVPRKHGDPLLLDCLSLLGSAYYHLYLSTELRALKTFARSNGRLSSLPNPQSRKLALKAVHYAANSWFVRAKLGIFHLRKTTALEYGAHSLVAGYEGGNVTTISNRYRW